MKNRKKQNIISYVLLTSAVCLYLVITLSTNNSTEEPIGISTSTHLFDSKGFKTKLIFPKTDKPKTGPIVSDILDDDDR